VIVSVHDLFPPTSWRVIRQLARTKIELLGRRRLAWLVGSPAAEVPRFALKAKVRCNLRPDAVTVRWLGRRRRKLMVCTEEERNRLTEFSPGIRVTVIPHFVEKRVLPMSRDDAKRALGLGGTRVVTLLGYIHPRKGHALLVDALSCLPPDVVAVVAGAAEPDHAAYLQQFVAAGRAAGNADRLRVTGYLPDRQLDLYLAATDLAVCPFTATSASGSLSTWLSASKRILASDIPQIAEYNRMEPHAIGTFSPYTASAFAQGIYRLLHPGPMAMDAAIGGLREKLSISRVLDHHIVEYTGASRHRWW
jgi:glycosyltransferase involved in cell wall biosynthesis